MSNDKTADLVADVLDRHHLTEPTGGVATGAWVQCSCGEFVAGHSRWHAQIQAQRHVARALADEGLITPATLHKEYVHAFGESGNTDYRWVSDVESSTDSKESSMSTSKKVIEVTMKPATEYGEIGGLPGNTVTIDGEEFYADSERNLIITDGDNEEVAIFASGEWRFARRVMDPNHIEEIRS